jgi:hypothetical protein
MWRKFMKAKIGSLIILMLFFISCSKETKQPEAAKSITPAQTNVEPAKRYQMKSGIITYKMENNMLGGKMTQILYFDDYGTKEARETITEMTMMGQTIKTHKMNIAKEGYVYDLDLDKKTGTKIKRDLPKSSEYDISKFSQEMLDQYNVKKLGSEEVAGKSCEKISMEYNKMNMKGIVWNWQGITLKSDIDMGKINVKTTATKVEENASVPASIFEIPSDVQIQDLDAKVK